jgi:outer membrane protein
MKNGLLIWNVVLTLLTGFLLIAHFGGKKGSGKGERGSSDTLMTMKPMRIAYFEMDSVASGFDVVKELKTELAKKEAAVQSEMDSRTGNIQEKLKRYQQQFEAGTMTQPQYDAASVELKKLEEDMRNRKAQLDQELNDFYVRRQSDIKSKIETYIKEFNKSKGYTYVLSDDPGLFYYRDTTLNITKEVIKGLNEMYKPEVKK